MSTLTIIQGNSTDKDNTRAYMVKGERGDDGISPTFETSKTGHTATITITDAEGTHTVTLTDGVSPTVETSKTGGVTTITITDEDGTHTATINDGQTYEVPAGAVIGFDGNTIPAGYEETQDTFGGGETLPVGSEIDYDGNTVPTGWQQTDDPDAYSTTETIIGTWINGKPRYRKVIDFGYLPDNTTKTVSTGLTFDSSHCILINLYGVGNYANGVAFALPNATSAGSGIIGLNLNSSSEVVVTTASDRTGVYAYIVLEYIKATD